MTLPRSYEVKYFVPLSKVNIIWTDWSIFFFKKLSLRSGCLWNKNCLEVQLWYVYENITQFTLVMKFDPADSFYERHLFWFRTGVSLFRFMLFLMEICDYYNGLMPKHYWITELCSIESEWHLISMYVKLPAQRSIISRKKCFVSPQVVISTSQLELLLGCDYLHYAQMRTVGGRINTLTNPR